MASSPSTLLLLAFLLGCCSLQQRGHRAPAFCMVVLGPISDAAATSAGLLPAWRLLQVQDFKAAMQKLWSQQLSVETRSSAHCLLQQFVRMLNIGSVFAHMQCSMIPCILAVHAAKRKCVLGRR
jgi:hypothetical protein